MPAPQQIKDLVERFNTHYDSYKNSQYNETQLRREFLDPFFKALGWDIDNEQGLAEAYKDVVHEDAIKIGGFTKAPDYCFRISGQRKFFVEAKKPSHDLKTETSPAFQLRRYGWSGKLPISILSDFEEFIVYDNRLKPIKSDKASKGRILYIRFTEYVDRWDEIASIFSKDAILKGSFDAFAEKSKIKKGADEVDKEFLKEIEMWREELAKDIAKNNPSLDTWQINFSVQKTIDRIIFLRIAEDRGIEQYGKLMALQNGDRVYNRLIELFERADEKYNSGLFHFKAEKSIVEPADELTQKIKISDDTLNSIFKNLYYPESPYEFSVLPADILGQVYEQFLGKVIRLTTGHRAVIEEKPEVRKAGGVYYTPTYIVDYIVKNTVGKLLENKTPKQVSKLRILDPACGSGSFLLGAYQYLLDWHRDFYTKNNPVELARGKNPILHQTNNGEWRLTTAEKRRIILNNIYGVDIDSSAVEVTKLSLSLKVLEGENEETLNRQLRLFHERALPDLGNNIKCGNSLIGPDYFTSQLMPDPAELHRINPFDWYHEFRDIMSFGGFDAVIGNPPWGAVVDSEVKWLTEKYPISAKRYVDTYKLFTDKAISLLKKDGTLGYILPSSFLVQPRFIDLKEYVSGFDLEIINLGDEIFHGVTAPCCIIVLRNTSSSENKYHDFRSISRDAISIAINDPDKIQVSATIKVKGEPLEKFFVIKDAGIQYHRSGIGKSKKGGSDLYERIYCTDKEKRFENVKPTWYGALVDRYFISPITDELFNLDFKKVLKEKESVTFNRELFDADEKILWRQTADKLRAVVDNKQRWFRNTLQGASVRPEYKKEIDIRYALALFNSSLFRYLYNDKVRESGRAFPQVKIGYLKNLPFVVVDKQMQEKIASLVGNILQLNIRFHDDQNLADHELIQRQITATDHKIDQEVYKLYGLTEEEIRIIESSN